MTIANTFFWFLDQTAGVLGGSPYILFLTANIIQLILAVWKFPKTREARKRLVFLLALPALWIFTGIWGSAFWYDWAGDAPPRPDWMLWVVNGAAIAFFIVYALFLALMKGARIFTLIFGVWNLYFMLAMWLLATMSITGQWL